MELPCPGEIVRVRARRYLVESVSNAPPPPDTLEGTVPPQSGLVRLSCLDEDAQGKPLQVLWRAEVDAKPLPPDDWSGVAQRGFDAPRRFAAYLNTQRWNCVTSTTPRLFQSPYRAGIQINTYQLEPLRKALALPRVNLFIADDVGLGKTIEAGLILRELLMRQKVQRVVVACPPSVELQWRDELEQRFGLSFVVLDRHYIKARRRERGFGVNPWETHAFFIISHARLRDEQYAGPLRSWLGDFSAGSLLILDEAHNAAPASGSLYAIDSRFTRVVREVANRFEHRLFLSATPHNGHSNAFSALLEILDPQRFCRGVPVTSASQLEPVMVRRLKKDLTDVNVPGFTNRRVVQIDINGLPEDEPELVLSQLLAEYTHAREARLASANRKARNASALITMALQKRLLSSVEAFARTLNQHCKTALRHWGEALATAEEDESRLAALKPSAQLELGLLKQAPGMDDDEAELSEEELEEAESAAMVGATRLAEQLSGGDEGPDAAAALELVQRIEQEKALLAEMTEVAENARGKAGPRLRHLLAWIQENLMVAGASVPVSVDPISGAPRLPARPTWNRRRVVIFTEYVATATFLRRQLNHFLGSEDSKRIALFQGGMGDEKREDLKRRFNTDPDEEALRILLATDAAREGVNLQNHCADLFHFDIPWNPSRMEQRNGRIDRKLQNAPEVRCHYFVMHQRAEDIVLKTLVHKTQRIRSELGSLADVVDARLSRRLDRGIRREDISRLTREINEEALDPRFARVVQAELEQTARDRRASLLTRLEELRKIKQESEDYLNLKVGHLRDALDCSLELLQADPLTACPEKGGVANAWQVPHTHSRLANDPSWRPTLDTLRRPRKRNERIWEWRDENPIRPVVFEDPGSIEGRVVHLHLEHRLVQRLLGRFLTQGFVHQDLSRACVLQTRDAIRRIVLLGKLSLYGTSASRLHEEIITVTAAWKELEVRERTPDGLPLLKAYARDAEGHTLRLLDDALVDPWAHQVDAALAARLAGQVADDVRGLLPLLEARAEALGTRASRRLSERGSKEGGDMAAVLERQRRNILKTQASLSGAQQLVMGFNQEESRQLDSDRRYWERRLNTIKTELLSEPARIRDLYRVKIRRIDPIGVVYLWPASG